MWVVTDFTIEQIELRIADRDRLAAELVELKAWKEQAIAVEATWDVQAVGKLLGILWGQDIRKNIQPKIEALQAELAEEKTKCDEAHKRAGERWKDLDAEKQDHAITKRELDEARRQVEFWRATAERRGDEIKRMYTEASHKEGQCEKQS